LRFVPSSFVFNHTYFFNSVWQPLPAKVPSAASSYAAVKPTKRQNGSLSTSFTEILENERKSHERAERNSKKPLALIQVLMQLVQLL